ncbi:hypothetical protein AXG93_868s1170 [Marchantia polymorpha subsp. ruderalis]|uniref:Uncharacterized protein n=1 Tax=Marchantia polymorpha subsp. ruderalis TaxID=1480154 RepID=A0A176VJZ5_MARPO|nr:hypothetical protein AXG93_868s1170 [Marchantia polymorpha subsp. ruderalis]
MPGDNEYRELRAGLIMLSAGSQGMDEMSGGLSQTDIEMQQDFPAASLPIPVSTEACPRPPPAMLRLRLQLQHSNISSRASARAYHSLDGDADACAISACRKGVGNRMEGSEGKEASRLDEHRLLRILTSHALRSGRAEPSLSLVVGDEKLPKDKERSKLRGEEQSLCRAEVKLRDEMQPCKESQRGRSVVVNPMESSRGAHDWAPETHSVESGRETARGGLPRLEGEEERKRRKGRSGRLGDGQDRAEQILFLYHSAELS